ncbi:hypothetical protein [Sphingomonas baiyangensis]|uniref:Uncharacterized protein n=1 Tax=Sphingomonas baiyangensis TaxID=2572576 RepID=A0A4U1L182_9SPHN|nr:hypothetical protein [Sphingomonas baiyangensis]TKD50581.1 hypothetical protein FBR43_07230 [Sphingomonas baiyangensis]
MSSGKKTTTTTQQSGTSQVQLPAWMTAAGEQLYRDASQTAAANPVQAYDGPRVAGMTGSQQQAGAIAQQSAGGYQADLNRARQYTSQATQGMPQVSAQNVGANGMQAAQQQWTGPGQMQSVSGQKAQVSQWNPATAGTAPMMQGAQQGVSLVGGAPQMSAAQQRDLATYQAAMQNQNRQVGVGMFDQRAAEQYMNPYLGAVRDNSVREMQRINGMERAALNDNAQAAAAFGGTRHALLESEQQRNQSESILDYLDQANADAYANAQGQFERDRTARFGADTFNVSMEDAVNARNAAALNAAGQFNAGSANQMYAANADRQQQAGLANQQLEGTFRLSDQAATNAMYGANADRQQQAGLANQQMQGQFSLANMDAQNAARQWNAGALNQGSQANADRAQQANLANQGTQQAYDFARQNAQNTALGANAAFQQQAGQFNADAMNTMGRANADRQFAASQANAGLHGDYQNRLLAAGQQFGQIGEAGSQLATQDILNLLRTGGLEQDTNQAALDARYQEFLRMQDAPMERYRDLMAILSGTPRNVTTSTSGSGTQTTKEQGSFLDTVLGLGQLGLSAYSGGLFGGKKPG